MSRAVVNPRHIVACLHEQAVRDRIQGIRVPIEYQAVHVPNEGIGDGLVGHLAATFLPRVELVAVVAELGGCASFELFDDEGGEVPRSLLFTAEDPEEIFLC